MTYSDIFRCRERDCEHIDDEEWHAHTDCEELDPRIHRCESRMTHQHLPRRSRGGRTIAWRWCFILHDAIDNGQKYQGRRWGNDIVDKDGERWTRLYDRDTLEVFLEKPYVERMVPA